MICRKCGNPIDENDRFCSKCGARVIKEPLNMSGEQKISRQDEHKNKNDKNDKAEFTGYVPPRETFNWNVNGFPKEHRKTEDIDFDWNLFEEFHRDMKGRNRDKTADSGKDEIAFAPEETGSGDDKPDGADKAKPAGPKLWHQDKDAEDGIETGAENQTADDNRTETDAADRTADGGEKPVGPRMWKPDRTAEDGTSEDRDTAAGPTADIESSDREKASAADKSAGTAADSRADDRAETEAFVWSKPVEEPISSAPARPAAGQAAESSTEQTSGRQETSAGAASGQAGTTEGADAQAGGGRMTETDAQTGGQTPGTDVQIEDRAEAKPDDITGAELEEAIFKDAGTPVDEEALKRQTAKIDKFYTFNKKNEEFQRLLDREYEKYNSGRPSDISEEREEISNESRGEMDEESWLPNGNEQIKEMAAARASLFADEDDNLFGSEPGTGSAEADQAGGERQEASGDVAGGEIAGIAGAGEKPEETLKPEADGKSEEISKPAADEKTGEVSKPAADEKTGEAAKPAADEGPAEASRAEADKTAADESGSDTGNASGENAQPAAEGKTGESEQPAAEGKTGETAESGTDEKPEGTSGNETDGKAAGDGKKGRGKQTGLTILAVILIIILIMLFIRIIAPDSVLSQKINAIPTLITGEQEEPIAVATDRSVPAEDKTGVIQNVAAMNVNNAIDDIIYDSSLKYSSSASYASSDISSSKKLKTNIYQKDQNGSIRYVDETVTGAAIGYASDKLKLGDHMKVFKIGEIRKGSRGYYIWVSENSSRKIFLVIDNGKTMTVSKTYSI